MAAEPDRLQQVLLILLDNARKCSPGGGSIWLSARLVGDEVEVTVRDHGLGIPGDALECVFARGYRVAAADRAGIPGNGLGLAIVREIVTAHGGRVWASSGGSGRGTAVSFTLPLAAGVAARPERHTSPDRLAV